MGRRDWSHLKYATGLRHLRRPASSSQTTGAPEHLVEKIAVCFWRLRRVLRYDFGNNQGHTSHVFAALQACAKADNHIEDLAEIRRELATHGFTDELKQRLLDSVGQKVSASAVNEKVFPFLLDEAIAHSQSQAQKARAELEELRLDYAGRQKSMDTLLRYETATERQLYRAIDQLERLQRQRAGEYVPPPVKVGVSADV